MAQRGNTAFVSLIVLIVTCAATLLIAVPTINYNIDDPNMIVYMDGDEGGFMDLIWYYYSGQKRPSFQWEFDSGLELVYLSDIGRMLSRFIEFTPGTFVLILRWFHLFSWIGALIALWYFMGYHFGKGWQQIAAVILLGTRTAFMYFLPNLKPSPLMLLLIILGLHYALKIVSKPSGRYFVISVVFASLAYLVKYAGIFLLPAIIVALYLSIRCSDENRNFMSGSSKANIAWSIPAIIGTAMVLGTLLVIMFYTRTSTGGTWFQEHGIWGSLLRNKIGMFLFFGGMAAYFAAYILWLLGRSSHEFIKSIMVRLNELGYYFFLTFFVFIGCIAIFGFKWLINPSYFIMTCAFLGYAVPTSDAIRLISETGFVRAFLNNLIFKSLEFGVIPMILFGFYVFVEFFIRKERPEYDRTRYFKRLVLLIFSIPLVIGIFSITRMYRHHMLPFFVTISVLSIQGIELFISSFRGRRIIKIMTIALLGILLIVDAGSGAIYILNTQLYRFHQKEDVAFDVARWWKANIPKDALVLTENYMWAYVPIWHENIIFSNCLGEDRVAKLRAAVDKYHPEFLYYNAGEAMEWWLPPMDEMLPGKKPVLLQSFNSNKKKYHRALGDRFVIYRLTY